VCVYVLQCCHIILLFLFKGKGKQTTVTMEKDWFDAVGNGNVERMQQLIKDKIPVDIMNKVNLGVL